MKIKPKRDKVFEQKASKPTLLERIKLLFFKEKIYFGEGGITYHYKEMNSKIFITREIIPDAIYVFKGN